MLKVVVVEVPGLVEGVCRAKSEGASTTLPEDVVAGGKVLSTSPLPLQEDIHGIRARIKRAVVCAFIHITSELGLAFLSRIFSERFWGDFKSQSQFET